MCFWLCAKTRFFFLSAFAFCKQQNYCQLHSFSMKCDSLWNWENYHSKDVDNKIKFISRIAAYASECILRMRNADIMWVQVFSPSTLMIKYVSCPVGGRFERREKCIFISCYQCDRIIFIFPSIRFVSMDCLARWTYVSGRCWTIKIRVLQFFLLF